ncbi:excinuclease ABC subunit UvrB, partial [Candidatus Auribacterota bacterium]
DQPQAIEKLTQGLKENQKHQVLLGVTGSGKTFSMANVIAQVNRPTLVMAHNKTLAAQLFAEFKELFPNNAVEYFVSYYDYYQPEAYLPTTDTYIEKDTSINEYIDKMRHSATRSLLERRDVLIVASVSCIYSLGSPESYNRMLILLEKNKTFFRDELLLRLVEIQYSRNDIDFSRGSFRVRGEYIEIYPIYEDRRSLRIEFGEDDVIKKIYEIDPFKGDITGEFDEVVIYPGSHYVTPKEQIQLAIKSISEELKIRIAYFKSKGKLLEVERIEQRTRFDLEMMKETGFCNGIENYSRHLSGRASGEKPHSLMTYFPKDFLLFIDESHITIPQIRGMYFGDRSRKQTLVEYGFRLPSALDNRPFNFDEFKISANQVIYVSATPAEYEFEKSRGKIVEQIIRPTGLLEPRVTLKPAKKQVDDLLEEIRKRVERKERVLVTTLTKKMSESLTDYYQDIGLKVKYLHSDIETIKRTQLIKELRQGKFDILIGINLLREGLDIPEVSLVAILDADKEGFLRSESSLIQTCGRAARNVNGTVIMYCDIETGSIKRACKKIKRRRKIQQAYNEKYKITPTTIKKNIQNILESICEADYVTVPLKNQGFKDEKAFKDKKAFIRYVNKLKKEMKKAADKLQFEKAAEIRDEINNLCEGNILNPLQSF